jgi:uncharacterized membrane protein
LVAGAEVLGIGASIATAALWGLGAVVARVGLLQARPSLLNLVTVLMGIPILLAILIGTGQTLGGVRLSASLLAVLAGVAACSQVAGVYLNYDSIRFIGASRNTIISSTRIIFSIALGVALLGEVVTTGEALGSSLVVVGVLALSSRDPGSRVFKMRRGVSEALLGAFIFSIGNVLVRVAAVAVGSAAITNLLADLIALPMLLVMVIYDMKELGYTGPDSPTWRLLVLIGALSTLASYTFFVALSVAPVVYVIPLSSSTPLFALVFSYMAISGMENINRRLVLGALLTIAGSIFIAVPL